jgi:hypothetical protein
LLEPLFWRSSFDSASNECEQASSEISEVLTAGSEVVLAPECAAKSIGFAGLFGVFLPVV